MAPHFGGRKETRLCRFPRISAGGISITIGIIQARHARVSHASVPIFLCNQRKFWILAFLTLAGLAPATLPAQNLLTNGDFEFDDRTSYPMYYAPPVDLAYIPLGQTVPGWTFSHSVDLYGPLNDPQQGSQFLDLVGGGPISATYSIQQSFATVIGYTYRLDFFYGNNEQFGTQGGQASFTASLVGLGTVWSGDFTHGGDTMSNRNWTEYTVDFVADSTSTTLMFLDTNHIPSTGDPTYTVAGATFDNVSVIGILPETGGRTVALAVFGVCLVAILRSKRAGVKTKA